jgi:hypothetical protein
VQNDDIGCVELNILTISKYTKLFNDIAVLRDQDILFSAQAHEIKDISFSIENNLTLTTFSCPLLASTPDNILSL